MSEELFPISLDDLARRAPPCCMCPPSSGHPGAMLGRDGNAYCSHHYGLKFGESAWESAHKPAKKKARHGRQPKQG